MLQRPQKQPHVTIIVGKKKHPRRLNESGQEVVQSENLFLQKRRLEDQVAPVDEMTSCPWFVPGEALPVVTFTTAAPNGDSDDLGEPTNSTEVEVVDDLMTNVISFHITGLNIVTMEDFTAVQKACAEGLASALSLPSPSWCAVSVQVNPKSCEFRVGISLPLSVARNSHLNFKLEPAIKMALFEAQMSGLIANMEFKMDDNVTNIQHEMLTKTCEAYSSEVPASTTSASEEDNSDESDELYENADSGIQVLPHVLALPVFIHLLP